MPCMSAPGDLRALGARIRRKVIWALALAAVMPLLVLAYVVQGYVLPVIKPADGLKVLGVHGLVFFTLVGVVAGASIIWSVGQTMARMGELMGRDPVVAQLRGATDEIGALMRTFASLRP